MANRIPKFEQARPPVRNRGEAGFMEWCRLVVDVSFDAYRSLDKQKEGDAAKAKLVAARKLLSDAALAAVKRRQGGGEAA